MIVQNVVNFYFKTFFNFCKLSQTGRLFKAFNQTQKQVPAIQNKQRDVTGKIWTCNFVIIDLFWGIQNGESSGNLPAKSALKSFSM